MSVIPITHVLLMKKKFKKRKKGIVLLANNNNTIFWCFYQRLGSTGVKGKYMIVLKVSGSSKNGEPEAAPVSTSTSSWWRLSSAEIIELQGRCLEMDGPPVTSLGQQLCGLWPNWGDEQCVLYKLLKSLLIRRNRQKFHQISINLFSSHFLDHTQWSIAGVGKASRLGLPNQNISSSSKDAIVNHVVHTKGWIRSTWNTEERKDDCRDGPQGLQGKDTA